MVSLYGALSIGFSRRRQDEMIVIIWRDDANTYTTFILMRLIDTLLYILFFIYYAVCAVDLWVMLTYRPVMQLPAT